MEAALFNDIRVRRLRRFHPVQMKNDLLRDQSMEAEVNVAKAQVFR